jgi:hypothetical protein
VLTSVAFAEGAKVVTLPGLDALPPKARQTAKIESKGATIRAITREIENGETVYELAMKKADGRTRDIIIGEDGTVLLAEDQVTLESLSPPIRNTFVKKAGKGPFSGSSRLHWRACSRSTRPRCGRGRRSARSRSTSMGS